MGSVTEMSFYAKRSLEPVDENMLRLERSACHMVVKQSSKNHIPFDSGVQSLSGKFTDKVATIDNIQKRTLADSNGVL
jgi:hypothetical protein